MVKRDIDSGRIDKMGRKIKVSSRRQPASSNRVIPNIFIYTDNDARLKEMDYDELTSELQHISEDPYIDWGSSSPQDFCFAMDKATEWHEGQKRSNRGKYSVTPYIEHPLRNTLRLHRWGVTDGEVLTATVLHDVIEDCADKITGLKAKEHGEKELREKAVEECTKLFGENVISIVVDVSNPIEEYDTREEKNAAYKVHLNKILSNPQSFLVKLSDYYDNAGGLHHNMIPGKEKRIRRMHDKYKPLVEVFNDKYENVKEKLPMEDTSIIVTAINNVRLNLIKVDKGLASIGE